MEISDNVVKLIVAGTVVAAAGVGYVAYKKGRKDGVFLGAIIDLGLCDDKLKKKSTKAK
ncbi:hypothetical protein Xoosp14_240 [Xanthomonas phage Xoo-sp14]|nr:hypothetical protein Xoosp14_240 [Xanthomonas phage Xoo-sp14]